MACPVHADVQGYISLIAQGKPGDALKLIREKNPFPSVCGRICPHPCEDVCRRGQVDQAISIASLKRFAAEYGNHQKSELLAKKAKAGRAKAKKVAVVGAGPSGLTAAFDLVRLGYSVIVFEKFEKPGGMLFSSIPKYRLPKEVLEEDINWIVSQGVEIKTGVEIGKDLNLNNLKEDFDVILISVGLQKSQALNIPGSDLQGVVPALPFLQSINSDRPMEVGQEVIIIGGGDVAIDSARVSLRLGSKKVSIVYRRGREEMPAKSWEIEEAEHEGVVFQYLTALVKVIGKNGKVASIECIKMRLGEPDESGRRRPEPIEGSEYVIEADTVILAIGQEANLSFLKDTGIGLDEKGQLVWDKSTFMMTEPGIFACGEVVTGPGSAIEAIASGHQAAAAIDNYLSGGALSEEAKEEMIAAGDLVPEIIEKIRRQERQKMPTVAVKERLRNFDQFELGFSETMAVREAQRCLSCTVGAEDIKEKCASCLTCMRICPYGVPVVEEGAFAGIRVDQCQSCGICAPSCPAAAIFMKQFSSEEILALIGEKLKIRGAQSEPVTLGFICNYLGSKSEESAIEVSLPESVEVISIFCPGRLDIVCLLKPVELGANGVFVVSCAEEDCRHPQGSRWVAKRVEYAKKILNDVGLDPNRLEIFSLSTPFGEELLKVAKEMVARLKG